MASSKSFVFRAAALALVAASALAPAPARADGKDKDGGKSGKDKDGKGDAAKAAAPTGKLNREEFEAALKPYLVAMHECYEKALKKDALAEGEVVLKLDTQNGKVLRADVDRDLSSLKLDDVYKCVIGVEKKMKMPLAKNDKGEHDPKAIASIKYPVEFSLGIDVEGGGGSVSGAKLDYDRVKKVFFYEKLSIGRCYLDAWKAKKGVAATGKLLLKVGVVGGTVTGVDAVAPDTTVGDSELQQCVFEAVKKFKFPSAKDAKGGDDPKAASTITYPLEFKAM
ncbi:MAG: hypothetical protein NVS3B10_17000 [Polyangiales bacterium]